MMTDLKMARHKEWRRIAKKERRRRIRTQLAKDRDKIFEDENWLKEQKMLESIAMEQIEKTNAEENEKWLRAEKIAMKHWQELQERTKIFLQERLEKEARLKLEWEKEQQRKKEEQERLKAIEEENKLKQELFMQSLEEFLVGDTSEPPQELQVLRETRPGVDLCPFFSKTACCRFGDQCSRNHQYPAISKVLLATNFYVHFGLNNTTQNEYDTDIMLEYEESDTYKEFKEFFHDVLSEFEKFGKIVQFRVCNNYEKHLRGNTYVEFAELRCAVAAYRALHTRWYGGRQLSLQFCFVNSWKNAICGLQLKKRCPKGRACNFLHVFRNPNNLFSRYNTSQYLENERSKRTPPRSWRWSESPEVEIPKKSRRDDDKSESRLRREEARRREDDNRRHRSRRRSSDRESERSNRDIERSVHRSEREKERSDRRIERSEGRDDCSDRGVDRKGKRSERSDRKAEQSDRGGSKWSGTDTH